MLAPHSDIVQRPQVRAQNKENRRTRHACKMHTFYCYAGQDRAPFQTVNGALLGALLQSEPTKLQLGQHEKKAAQGRKSQKARRMCLSTPYGG